MPGPSKPPLNAYFERASGTGVSDPEDADGNGPRSPTLPAHPLPSHRTPQSKGKGKATTTWDQTKDVLEGADPENGVLEPLAVEENKKLEMRDPDFHGKKRKRGVTDSAFKQRRLDEFYSCLVKNWGESLLMNLMGKMYPNDEPTAFRGNYALMEELKNLSESDRCPFDPLALERPFAQTILKRNRLATQDGKKVFEKLTASDVKEVARSLNSGAHQDDTISNEIKSESPGTSSTYEEGIRVSSNKGVWAAQASPLLSSSPLTGEAGPSVPPPTARKDAPGPELAAQSALNNSPMSAEYAQRIGLELNEQVAKKWEEIAQNNKMTDSHRQGEKRSLDQVSENTQKVEEHQRKAKEHARAADALMKVVADCRKASEECHRKAEKCMEEDRVKKAELSRLSARLSEWALNQPVEGRKRATKSPRALDE